MGIEFIPNFISGRRLIYVNVYAQDGILTLDPFIAGYRSQLTRLM